MMSFNVTPVWLSLTVRVFLFLHLLDFAFYWDGFENLHSIGKNEKYLELFLIDLLTSRVDLLLYVIQYTRLLCEEKVSQYGATKYYFNLSCLSLT